VWSSGVLGGGKGGGKGCGSNGGEAGGAGHVQLLYVGLARLQTQPAVNPVKVVAHDSVVEVAPARYRIWLSWTPSSFECVLVW